MNYRSRKFFSTLEKNFREFFNTFTAGSIQPAFFIYTLYIMLTINLIREKKDFITERLKVKNFDARDILDRIISLDTERRDTQTRADQMQGEMNRISKGKSPRRRDHSCPSRNRTAALGPDKDIRHHRF